MNEEDEFGLNKMVRDADPLEQDARSVVKDHPDFTFLDVAAALEDKGAMPLWLTRLPVEKDPSHWTILEVHIRPDRSWEVIKDLLSTVCISKGLLIAEEDAKSVLFRKRVVHESMAHGMANMATFLNVYVRVGVSSSKLRVIDICTLVMNENKLLGGMMPMGSSRLWTARDAKDSHQYALDQLLGAFQSTLLSQCLSMSHLYMSTPETSMDSVQTAELDEGFVEDLKKAFTSEMKTNMRDLCIPLESYAYDQEFACAQLIGLLESTLKKCLIRLVGTGTNDACLKGSESVIVAGTQDLSIKENASAHKEGLVLFPQEINPVDPSPSKCQATPAAQDKIYGEVISEMVQKLRSACKEDCEIRLRAKIEEKRRQVTARVETAQSLRARAIRAIVEAKDAQVSYLNEPADDNRRNSVLLYETSCMINGIPVTLHVTYGYLIYRTMVPVFAHTAIIPFDDVLNVTETASFGIQAVSIELDSTKHAKGITIAMGLEVNLLYQLLHELFSMHQREIKASTAAVPPLQQQELEKNRSVLQMILGSDEEETKEEKGTMTPAVDVSSTLASANEDGSTATSASN